MSTDVAVRMLREQSKPNCLERLSSKIAMEIRRHACTARSAMDTCWEHCASRLTYKLQVGTHVYAVNCRMVLKVLKIHCRSECIYKPLHAACICSVGQLWVPLQVLRLYLAEQCGLEQGSLQLWQAIYIIATRLLSSLDASSYIAHVLILWYHPKQNSLQALQRSQKSANGIVFMKKFG